MANLSSSKVCVTPPTRNWRFNMSLLREQDFIHYFKKEWLRYLENNELPGISQCVLWETGKVIMWGKIISFCSHKKNKEKTL